MNVGGTISGGGTRTTSSSSPPAIKSVGDIWYNTSTDAIYRYTTDGTNAYWIDITGPIVSNSTATLVLQAVTVTSSTQAAITAVGTLTTLSVSGTSTHGGLASFNYTGVGATSTIAVTGQNSKGGTLYHDFLSATNGLSTATNATKWFRISNLGTLEVLNSAYTATIFSVTDNGFIAINGSSGATDGIPVNNGIAMRSNSYIFDDGNYHITSKSGSIWLNANDGSTVNVNTQMPSGITGGGMTVQGAITSNASGSTAFIAGTGAISGVALRMPQSGAIRDVYNGASTIYFDVSTGGSTNGDFQFRSSNAFTNYLTINSSGLTSRTPSLGKLAWNSAAATELTVDNYRFRVQSSGSPTAQIISNTGGTVNSAWTAVAAISGSAIGQTGSSGALISNSAWTNLYGSNMGSAGDTITVTLQDKSVGRIYRVTFMRSDDGTNTGYNIIAERLL